jgi:UDP-N-acetyl-D-galactosamine dehydrogenase
VDVIDPGASPEEVRHEYGITLKSQPSGKYDAVIVAVPHKAYKDLDEDYFRVLLNDNGILVDLKGLYRGKIKSLTYWSL